MSVLSKAPLSLSLDLTALKQLYYSRAEALTHKGYLDQAIGDYTKLIELNPQFSEYYLMRGRLYEMKGDKAAAIANYKALLGASPTSDPAQKALVRLEGSNLILPGNHRDQLRGTVR